MMEKITFRVILLSNLIGIFNAGICGISITLIRMHNFSFPMISNDDVPFLTLMVVITVTVLYLLQNLFTVNLIVFLLNKTKTKKMRLSIVLFCAVISGFITALLLTGENLATAITMIGWKIPEEVWITTIIYLIGFYFLFIRKMGDHSRVDIN